MGSIFLIRHGQASFGAENYDVLSPLGERQSQALGDHLAQLDISFDRCLSGQLKRQQDTARATLGRLAEQGHAQPELEIDPAFDEFEADAVLRAHLPDLQAYEPNALHILRNAADHRAEFQRLFSYVIQRWVSGEHDKHGLESWQSFVERVGGGLERILAQAGKRDRIAVFTSGGTITALLQLIIGVPPIKAFEMNWQIVNTSLNLLKFRGREVSLASFNSQAHLQLLKNPELITHR
ncbi:histidine phosphatase family protein [Pseudomonas oligotrophica]|uniref:histidine phosphatase family protein n=1 Tax=Pseudomonas oligotrophica TaxID=2912055 RepID=UPI001F456950|nr:histidine phosphatase family protein [Pseudomonas oligotrophica]MCF7203528.1 histidine phosphatase family protein [Pseudomonas oligotrophica]